MFGCPYGWNPNREYEESTAKSLSVCCEPKLVDVTPWLKQLDDFTTPLTNVNAKCCCINGACEITPLAKLMKTVMGYEVAQGGCGEISGKFSYTNREKRNDGPNECMIPLLSKEEHFGKDGEEKEVTKKEEL
jgi:hypothetical protein